MEKLLRCPFTDKDVTTVIHENYMEYLLNYFDNEFAIRIDKNIDWNDPKIQPSQKIILQGMLYNNEWPIESETVITLNLIDQVLRLGEYPRNFNEKLDYYLLQSYLEGGAEYIQIIYGDQEPQIAYAESQDEFSRIIKALESKSYIELDTDVFSIGDPLTFSFTESGIQRGLDLNTSKKSQEPKQFSLPHPKLAIIAVKEDYNYASKLQDYFLQFGFTVTLIDKLDESTSYAHISNNKDSFYDNRTDYVLFVKSSVSDKINSFGSFLDIAIEAHERTEKRNYNFIYIAYVTDLSPSARPRIDNYLSTTFDFRIKTNRKRLVQHIAKDWHRRHASTDKSIKQSRFKFPVFPLTEYEQTWLKVIYQHFLTNQNVNYRGLWASIWKDSPLEFEPAQMNPLLARGGTEITLFGIWHIHPESDLFEKFDKTVLAVKEILQTNHELDKITSEQIQAKFSGITTQEVRQIFKLMSLYQDFTDSMGIGGDGSSNIGVGNDRIYKNYRHYKGLQKYIDDLVKTESSKEEAIDKNNSPEEENINLTEIHSYRTPFHYKDKIDINPVMGVVSLAKDLAEIIESLPSEKGQMVGIFGKWGRGKTFLLTELWKLLEKNSVPRYIRIDYHAWKYQETPASWAYLYELFADKYLGEKKGCKIFTYYWRLIRLNYMRIGVWPSVKFILTIISTITTSIASWLIMGPYATAVIPIIGILALSYLKKLHQEFSTKATNLIKKYSTRHSFKEVLGVQADIQEELIKLLKTWVPTKEIVNQRIILFVEDIDRCMEERIMQNIDALRIMLEDDAIAQRVIIVTAIDERILKNAIRQKYESFYSSHAEDQQEIEQDEDIHINKLIAEYIDKAFIAAIKLGGLNNFQKQEYLNELFRQEVESEVLGKAADIGRTRKSQKETGFTEEEQLEGYVSNTDFIKDRERMKEGGGLGSQGRENHEIAITDGNNRFKDYGATLQDSKENIIDMPEITKNIKDRINQQNKSEKLTPIEVLILGETVRNWNTATPRRIRIFYYRYLLSKNLILNQYIRLNRLNVWQNEKGIATLMSLILYFTKRHDPTLITKMKNKILVDTKQKTKITEIDSAILADPADYLYMLEILELVIAY